MGVLIIPGIPGYGQNPYGLAPYGDPYSPSAGEFESIDHVALGLSRIIQEFRESVKLLAFITAVLQIGNELEASLISLLALPDIDSMVGANLDTIGIIVGASRYITNVVLLDYFGFDEGYVYMKRFGEETNISIGARFYEEGENFSGTSKLGDAEFRLAIKAKIVKNQSKGTGEDVLNALTYLFNTTAHVTDNYDMSFSISIDRAFTSTENALLSGVDILPRPAGVRVILP